MIRAVLSWLMPMSLFEPSSVQWVQALRASGYRPTFSANRMPNAEIRRLSIKSAVR